MSHRIAAVALCFTAVFFCILAAVGCNNSPGSLVLRVTSVEPPTKASEPIRVRATLEAVRGPVCLHQSAFMVWELTPPGPDAEPIRSDRKMAYCGTGIAECLLLSPILYPACLLDVADSQGRYTVMQTGDCREFDLPIHVGDLAARPWTKESADRQAESSSNSQCERAASSQAEGAGNSQAERSNSARTEEAGNAQAEEPDAAWTPGEYTVVLHLRNEVQHGGGSILPPPLFWIPYNQAVDVSVNVRIAPATTNENSTPNAKLTTRAKPTPIANLVMPNENPAATNQNPAAVNQNPAAANASHTLLWAGPRPADERETAIAPPKAMPTLSGFRRTPSVLRPASQRRWQGRQRRSATNPADPAPR